MATDDDYNDDRRPFTVVSTNKQPQETARGGYTKALNYHKGLAICIAGPRKYKLDLPPSKAVRCTRAATLDTGHSRVSWTLFVLQKYLNRKETNKENTHVHMSPTQ